MTTIIFIEKNQRNSKKIIINEIADAVFGSEEQIAFSDEFVPLGGRVPNPKSQNFARYLLNVPRLLWAVKYENITVGFILIHDQPHQNAMGISINSNYSRRGIATEAFNLIKNQLEMTYPVFGYTSIRNISAQRFMEKIGFINQNENINFCGEDSFKYKFEK